MSFLSKMAFGFALVCALGSAAFAQGAPQSLIDLGEGSMLMISPTGKVMTMRITNKEAADMMMKEGAKMTSGMMVMMHGGQTYLMQDKKMPDGRMLSDMMLHQ